MRARKNPPPPPQRRTQSERSEETRERLLRAALDVLAASGYAGFTVAEVAAKAGVSGGARVHHFRSKADLVLAARDYAYRQALEKGLAVTRSPAARKDPLRTFIQTSEALYFSRHFMVSTELIIGVHDEPEHLAAIAAIMDNYRSTINRAWLDVFVKAGIPAATAREIIDLTLFLLRGMGLNAILSRDPNHHQAGLKAWLRIAEKLIERQAYPSRPPKARHRAAT
jgi:AcrR family transcriptional regulator